MIYSLNKTTQLPGVLKSSELMAVLFCYHVSAGTDIFLRLVFPFMQLDSDWRCIFTAPLVRC